ncbi:MAG: hypothetical protein V4689_06895 [Verrucomicrobiota bacterium]
MQILGLRTSPSTVRYAIVEWDGQDARLLNANSEHKLDFPADKVTIAAKVHWLREELIRILRQNPQVCQIALKTNEYSRRGESSASREAAHLDAAALIVAGEKSLPIRMLLYTSIGTRRAEVKSFAESNVGQLAPYWNEQIADAVAAAWTTRTP